VSQWDSDLIDEQYTDGIKILERLVFDLDVPTIAVINARSGGQGSFAPARYRWHWPAIAW